MTPEQTEVILEEYIEMNRPREDPGTEVPIDQMAVTSDGEGHTRVGASGVRVALSPEGEDLARRLKAEMAEKLGVSAQTPKE